MTSLDIASFVGDSPITKVSVKVVNTGDGLSKSMKVKPTGALRKGDQVDVLMRTVVEKFHLAPADRDDLAECDWELVIELRAGTATVVKSETTDEIIDTTARLLEEAAGVQRLPDAVDDDIVDVDIIDDDDLED